MITEVAIRFRGTIYSCKRPLRHHHVIRQIVMKTGAETVDVPMRDQGFLDDRGNYLTRGQALAHALRCGQLPCDYTLIGGGVLTSEDLW